MTTWLITLTVMMLILSWVALLMYWWDKRRAQKEGRRVSEKALHIVSLLGGWPGALIARAMLRHKTLKVRFRVIFWLTIVAHLALAAGVTWLVDYMAK